MSNMPSIALLNLFVSCVMTKAQAIDHLIPLKLGKRAFQELTFKVQWKVAYLYAYKGWKAIRAHKSRQKKGKTYPPFMFIALTNTCNLRCKGCWVEKEGQVRQIEEADLESIIESGKRAKSHYFTLLGGEPFLYPKLWSILERHPDCYFQIITNGMFFNEHNVRQLKKLANITPLISLDGWEKNNDQRRGDGVYASANEGMNELKENGLLFGIATTITSKNWKEVMSDAYLQHFINKGAMYIWYYVYRPVGEHSHQEYCLDKQGLIEVRKKLLEIRRKFPIMIIDTYWTSEGEAFCPAACGLGYHIGPEGSIEICPPLSFACEKVSDNGGDMIKSIQNSAYLNGFNSFVNERTKGCVILEHPQELADYIEGHHAKDYSTRDGLGELRSITPRHSHHLVGSEIPEDFWFYRLLKKQVFFGMGAVGS